jgi:hydroxymethylglutaryl-CoA lyase
MPAERVRITDVSPRDGLQNEPGVISTADKVRLVELLSRTGVDEVEVSSFVSPKWVPQLADGAEVLAQLSRTAPVSPAASGRAAVTLSVLVPNEKGMLGVMEVNRAAGFDLIGKVAVFTAASETFSLRNTNATIAQTLDRFKPIIALAREHRLPVRGYVSCIVACPFEGPIDPANVGAVARDLIGLGVDEIDLGDTIGAGTPRTIAAAVRRVIEDTGGLRAGRLGERLLTLHLHDTFGRAAECVKTALEMGVRSFDGSVAGLGGCPYASTPSKRAPGNISTETLVRTIDGEGYRTGVVMDRLSEAAAFARRIVSVAPPTSPASTLGEQEAGA